MADETNVIAADPEVDPDHEDDPQDPAPSPQVQSMVELKVAARRDGRPAWDVDEPVRLFALPYTLLFSELLGTGGQELRVLCGYRDPVRALRQRLLALGAARRARTSGPPEGAPRRRRDHEG